MSLRLSGNLPDLEELTDMGITPTKVLRRGEQVSKKRVQPVDIWSLEFANFDSDRPREDIDNQMQQAALCLEKMAPTLAVLDRTNCNVDLYISTIREEQQGGISLSPEIVAAAAAARLSIQISILVMLDDYEESEPESKLSTMQA
ncbi:DUF4279 domain-containing protein [Coleofasciculus sp. H7-2]|uniref:DUF4279 domain-containing protein n=1 Tax=Coleofasciculus sp. H7-2 TaxID=3351545 RepID=UPI00366C0818